MQASDVMTKNPHAAPVTATLGDVLEILRSEDVRHVPITDDGRVVGVISDRDLPRLSFGLEGANARARLSTRIAELMSSDVVAVEPHTDLAEVIDLMIENKIGAVPVVDPDDGALVGIVSYVDVLRAAHDLV